MPKIVVQNDPVAPLQSALATTLFTKSDGLYYIREDGVIVGPLGVGIGGPAGGALTGTYPNPGIAPGAVNINQLANGSVTGPKIANAAISLAQINPSLIDPIPTLPGLRTLGTGPQQAVAGNDLKLYNARVPTGTAAGAGSDLGGTYPSPTIAKLQGFPLSIVTPAIGNVLTWNGVNWVAAPGGGGGGITQLTADVTAGPGSGSQPATVVRIQTRPVNPAVPAPGDALVWNGLAWTPTPVAVATPPSLLSGLWLDPTLLLAVGTLVRVSVADTVVAAARTSPATALPFVGIITAIPAPGTVTVAYYGELPAVGLIAGARYFLDLAGAMVTPAPAPVVGQVALYVGYAKSATVFVLAPNNPVFL